MSKFWEIVIIIAIVVMLTASTAVIIMYGEQMHLPPMVP